MTNWRPVKSHPNYEVSEDGQVRRAGRVLKAAVNPRTGYLTYSLYQSNRETRRYVHHLVAEAFIGPRPDGYEVAHGDGDKSNNRASNLRYATRAENEADKIAHGTRLSGSDAPWAKLTEAAVRDIRAWATYDFTQREIARWYGVSDMLVSLIVRGKIWTAEATVARMDSYSQDQHAKGIRAARERHAARRAVRKVRAADAVAALYGSGRS